MQMYSFLQDSDLTSVLVDNPSDINNSRRKQKTELHVCSEWVFTSIVMKSMHSIERKQVETLQVNWGDGTLQVPGLCWIDRCRVQHNVRENTDSPVSQLEGKGQTMEDRRFTSLFHRS